MDDTIDQARGRLATYRGGGSPAGVLMVPLEALTSLEREASLLLAAEWGGELARVDRLRLEFVHADDPSFRLAEMWLKALSNPPFSMTDMRRWVEDERRWREDGAAPDPRLVAFMDGWRAAASAYRVPPPGPRCKCPSCVARRRKRRAPPDG
ncbi:MAG TPA: hypothetical protein VF625_16660 [Longimicrobium sp.]